MLKQDLNCFGFGIIAKLTRQILTQAVFSIKTQMIQFHCLNLLEKAPFGAKVAKTLRNAILRQRLMVALFNFALSTCILI